MIELLGFHHVAITVKNCDTSVEWYANVLGFEEVFREASDERKACIMRFPGGEGSVGFVEHGSSEHADTFDPRRLGLDHLAFSVGSQDALEAFGTHLAAVGVSSTGPFFSPRGGILNFKDPDGIALAVFWDRA